MSLSDEDREVLAPLFRDGYGFTGPTTVEAIVARHVTAALSEAALRIAEFDASDDYHQSDIEAPDYYSALFRAESLLRGEIRV